MKIRAFAVLTLSALLAACTPPPTPTAPDEPVVVLTPDPAYTPAVSAADPTLKGTDRDQNGLRDDLDALLTGPDMTDAHRRAVRGLYNLSVGRDTSAALLVAYRDLRAQRPAKADAEISALQAAVLNTEARLNRYAAMQGTSRGAFVPFKTVQAAASAPVIVFQNGIFTTEDTAWTNVAALRDLLGVPADYYLNYNPTDGLGDLVEVFAQKNGEGGTYLTRVLEGLRALGDWRHFSLEGLLDLARDLLGVGVKSVRSAREGGAYFDARVTALAGKLDPLLRTGRRVVLVPHSQGNLYANAVYAELQRLGAPLGNLRIVGAAVPGATLPGTYVTSASDMVINGLRLLYPVASANDYTVPVWQQEDLVLGHSFTSIYANPDLAIGKRFKSAVLAALE